jgi:hypothetical protein
MDRRYGGAHATRRNPLIQRPPRGLSDDLGTVASGHDTFFSDGTTKAAAKRPAPAAGRYGPALTTSGDRPIRSPD